MHLQKPVLAQFFQKLEDKGKHLLSNTTSENSWSSHFSLDKLLSRLNLTVRFLTVGSVS